jgi:hypothetical protein
MMRNTRRAFHCDELETRALLSTTTGGGVWSNPAVQADLAKIQTDTKALQTEIKTLAPTLRTDQQAIQTAVQNAVKNDATVTAAETTLKNDQATARTTLQNDLKAYFSATTRTARQAALKVYLGDLSSAGKTFATDEKAIQTAINADAGVMAAVTKFKSDDAPIVADVATLQADYKQLGMDIPAAITSASSSVRVHM